MPQTSGKRPGRHHVAARQPDQHPLERQEARRGQLILRQRRVEVEDRQRDQVIEQRPLVPVQRPVVGVAQQPQDHPDGDRRPGQCLAGHADGQWRRQPRPGPVPPVPASPARPIPIPHAARAIQDPDLPVPIEAGSRGSSIHQMPDRVMSGRSGDSGAGPAAPPELPVERGCGSGYRTRRAFGSGQVRPMSGRGQPGRDERGRAHRSRKGRADGVVHGEEGADPGRRQRLQHRLGDQPRSSTTRGRSSASPTCPATRWSGASASWPTRSAPSSSPPATSRRTTTSPGSSRRRARPSARSTSCSTRSRSPRSTT